MIQGERQALFLVGTGWAGNWSASPRGTKVVEGTVADVVLVDDATGIRVLIRHALSLSSRFRIVGEAANGLEAITLAQQHQPDLLILDVAMPDMDGLEALPKIRVASPSTRVVMFSAFSAADNVKEALRLGAVDFLPKGIPLTSLASRLLDALTRPIPEPPVAPQPEPAPTEPPLRDSE